MTYFRLIFAICKFCLKQSKKLEPIVLFICVRHNANMKILYLNREEFKTLKFMNMLTFGTPIWQYDSRADTYKHYYSTHMSPRVRRRDKRESYPFTNNKTCWTDLFIYMKTSIENPLKIIKCEKRSIKTSMVYLAYILQKQ